MRSDSDQRAGSSSRKAHAFELLETLDQQVPVGPAEIALLLADSEVQETPLIHLLQDSPVEPGEAVLLHLPAELLLHLPFALHAELEGDDLAGAVTDAMGDIVAGDVESLPVVGHAPDNDMAVPMAGVVVIDRDPNRVGSAGRAPSAP
jgi:hypothetical protein